MEPCEQKDNIAKIQAKLESRDEMLAEMRVKQAEIAGDITHIKSRIDNGMGHSISNMNIMLTELKPVIGHHADIVKRIEGIGWTLATSLIIALIAYMAWGISHGFKLPI